MPDAPATAETALFGGEDLYDLLWQVTAYSHLAAESALAGTPLTPASASMMMAIAAEPGMTVAAISRRIPKTPQTISQVVARLEKLLLVERRVGSGRGVQLYATAAGEAMAELASSRQKAVSDHLRSTLGDARADALADLLRASREVLRTSRPVDGSGSVRVALT